MLLCVLCCMCACLRGAVVNGCSWSINNFISVYEQKTMKVKGDIILTLVYGLCVYVCVCACV